MIDWKGILRGIKNSLTGGGVKSKTVTAIKSETQTNQPVIDERSQKYAALCLNAKTQNVIYPALKSKPPQVKLGANGIPITLNNVPCHRLVRQCYYKVPDPWVKAGSQTQLAPLQGSLPIDIVIGLDFGTSYTKAAVGLKDKIFPVKWDGITAAPDSYLLPSEYSVLSNGSCQLGQATSASIEQIQQQLKHPFLDPPVSLASMAKAVVFLALTLRYIRAWTFHHHGGKIGKSQIRWLLNIGAPSNGLETGSLEDCYKALGGLAWKLSMADIQLEIAKQMVADWNPDSLLDNSMFLPEILPEFVAQIAGYVQSAQRRSGLHALVDVGGGTLDVVTFIVHERSGEDVYPFLIPEVTKLGTQMLNQNRLVDAPACYESILPDGQEAVLQAIEYAGLSGISVSHVVQRDARMWKEVRNTVQRVLHKTKHERYRLAPAWKNGLPIFMTGGGGKIEGYIDSVKTGSERQAASLDLLPLPQHPRLADFTGSSDDYQRISVACGLALDAFSLGQIIPAKDVEDDIAPQKHADERPDCDELYPH